MKSKNFSLTPGSFAHLLHVSILTLFIEMVIVRWVSTEINIFAYLQNSVLVICFLGLGAGFLLGKSTVRATDCLLPLGFCFAET